MIAEITIILPITSSTSRKATSTARETTLPKGLNVRTNTSLLTKNPELTIAAAMTTSMRTSTLKKNNVTNSNSKTWKRRTTMCIPLLTITPELREETTVPTPVTTTN